MSPSHLQRALFQRTLAPRAWEGAKGTPALVRTPPTPQKCPLQGCQLGPQNGSCPAGPGWGHARAQPDMVMRVMTNGIFIDG